MAQSNAKEGVKRYEVAYEGSGQRYGEYRAFTL
jgi:hypothetical protein